MCEWDVYQCICENRCVLMCIHVLNVSACFYACGSMCLYCLCCTQPSVWMRSPLQRVFHSQSSALREGIIFTWAQYTACFLEVRWRRREAARMQTVYRWDGLSLQLEARRASLRQMNLSPSSGNWLHPTQGGCPESG